MTGRSGVAERTETLIFSCCSHSRRFGERISALKMEHSENPHLTSPLVRERKQIFILAGGSQTHEQLLCIRWVGGCEGGTARNIRVAFSWRVVGQARVMGQEAGIVWFSQTVRLAEPWRLSDRACRIPQ